MSKTTNWLLGALACALLLAAQLLDHPDAEQDVADEAQSALASAATKQEADRIAKRVCAAAAGPGAQVLWTTDGDLVCRPARLVSLGGEL